MKIKVIGPGCAKCRETENVIREAVREAGSSASVEKVTDFREIMALGVLSTPAVVVDGKIVCSGRVPSRAEALGWIGSGAVSG